MLIPFETCRMGVCMYTHIYRILYRNLFELLRNLCHRHWNGWNSRLAMRLMQIMQMMVWSNQKYVHTTICMADLSLCLMGCMLREWQSCSTRPTDLIRTYLWTIICSYDWFKYLVPTRQASLFLITPAFYTDCAITASVYRTNLCKPSTSRPGQAEEITPTNKQRHKISWALPWCHTFCRCIVHRVGAQSCIQLQK